MSKALGDALRRVRDEKDIKLKDMAAHVGVSGPAISQWEAGQTEPTSRNYTKACEYLGIDPNEFLSLFDEPPSLLRIKDEPANLTEGIEKMLSALPVPSDNKDTVARPVSFKRRKPWGAEVPSNELPLARDVPVYGIAVGGEDGDFQFNGQEIDRVQRPAALANVAGMFAVYLSSDSMYPAWREGALLFVSPYRQAKPGDDIIVELKSSRDGEPGKAFLKRLVSRNQNIVTVEQFNPAKKITFKEGDISKLFRVVPYEEALGIS